MLARQLPIISKLGIHLGDTPLLVPSLSSRANIDIKKTIEMIAPTVTGPILVSAYDIHYANILPNFGNLAIIDSGGYESAKDKEISDIGLYRPDSKEWKVELCTQVIKKLEDVPIKVVVSFDHPAIREPIQEQIKHAREFFRGNENFIKEFLIKPEKPNSGINMNNVFNNISNLNEFDIIGFTEKELGSSVIDRMAAIARLRKKMNENGLNKPIHVFGSLDPITTPLYYLSGADIFDGLAWLRFYFWDENSFYVDSFGPYKKGIHANNSSIWASILSDNYISIGRLRMNLINFQRTKNFEKLGMHHDFFERSWEDLCSIVGDI